MGSHRRKKWRIYQFLSSMGAVSSKKEAVDLARSGRLHVDGKVMESLHYQVNPIKQVITIDNKRIELKENRRYFAFNKPKGILSTKDTILEFFDLPTDIRNSLSPVGRLDKDSSGLMLVTNDGRLSQRVLDPKTKRKKVYEVGIEGEMSEESLQKLRDGVWIRTDIDDVPTKYRTLPAEAKMRSKKKVHITITEGKKRQVRKMCEAVGHKVLDLKRIAIAKLKIGMLKPGTYKELKKEEIYRLLFE